MHFKKKALLALSIYKHFGETTLALFFFNMSKQLCWLLRSVHISEQR